MKSIAIFLKKVYLSVLISVRITFSWEVITGISVFCSTPQKISEDCGGPPGGEQGAELLSSLCREGCRDGLARRMDMV